MNCLTQLLEITDRFDDNLQLRKPWISKMTVVGLFAIPNPGLMVIEWLDMNSISR